MRASSSRTQAASHSASSAAFGRDRRRVRCLVLITSRSSATAAGPAVHRDVRGGRHGPGAETDQVADRAPGGAVSRRRAGRQVGPLDQGPRRGALVPPVLQERSGVHVNGRVHQRRRQPGTLPLETTSAPRRELLLRAAADLFAARGFHDVGMDDIGAAAGITGPGVYRHFASQQALLEDLSGGRWAHCRRGRRPRGPQRKRPQRHRVGPRPAPVPAAALRPVGAAAGVTGVRARPAPGRRRWPCRSARAGRPRTRRSR